MSITLLSIANELSIHQGCALSILGDGSRTARFLLRSGKPRSSNVPTTITLPLVANELSVHQGTVLSILGDRSRTLR